METGGCGKKTAAADVRLAGLDALRGVAAMMVMLHHVVPMMTGIDVLPQGFLSVDMFFMLSGFVVARAYDAKLRAGLPLTRFIVLRIRRLYPVIIVGIGAGALVALLQGASAAIVLHRLVAEALFIPSLDGHVGIYRLDGVQWSLFFEILANIVYAGILWRLPGHWLTTVVLLSLASLGVAAFLHGSLAIGDRGDTFFGGLPRVSFSYTLGVTMFAACRVGRLPVPKTRSPVILLALPLLFCILGPPGATAADWWIELAIVALVFPLILVGAIGLHMGEVTARAARLAGALSFPLYALHLPAAGAVMAFERWHGPLGNATALGLTITVALGASWLLSRFLERRPRGRADKKLVLAGRMTVAAVQSRFGRSQRCTVAKSAPRRSA